MPRPKPKFQMNRNNMKEDRGKIQPEMKHLPNHRMLSRHQKVEKSKVSEIPEHQPESSERNMNSPMLISEIGVVLASKVEASQPPTGNIMKMSRAEYPPCIMTTVSWGISRRTMESM